MTAGETTRVRLRHLVACLVLAYIVAAPALALATDNSPLGGSPAPIEFWNREITVQREMVGGASPEERAERAVERLDALPLNVRASDLTLIPVKLDGHDGITVTFKGKILFFIGSNDLDKEVGETLAQASHSALLNLNDALKAREEERSWPVIRAGLLFSLIGLTLLVLAITLIWKGQGRVARYLRGLEISMPHRLRLFGLDAVPHILRIVYSLLRLAAWALTVGVLYAWTTLSLRRFPYTQPWGVRLGSYVLHLLQHFGEGILHALPGLLAVLIIFLITRWIVRMGTAFFDQVSSNRMRLAWMDPEVARATQRIFSAVAWIFAIVVAYPYIPGSGTEAFKGISVFFGLVISLGSTGIINQVISGLFVVYSKALKPGEWVRVNDTEGEVLEVGLLAGKIRTIEGQEVTIPNSVLVSTSTINYTRLGYPDGTIASSTVTIGYDAPWRQVHALLLMAADRTTMVRKQPAPYVLQRELSDFYVQYTVIVRLLDEKRRIQTLSELHSQIQDAFNEFGVQIMSPHYMMQPDGAVVIPPSKWRPAPAAAGPSDPKESQHAKPAGAVE